MIKRISAIVFHFLLLSGVAHAGGMTSTGGGLSASEILDSLTKVGSEQSKGIFIPDDNFIELLGVLEKDAAVESPVSINAFLVKDGISALKGYNSEKDMEFVIFCESQKAKITDLTGLIKSIQVQADFPVMYEP